MKKSYFSYLILLTTISSVYSITGCGNSCASCVLGHTGEPECRLCYNSDFGEDHQQCSPQPSTDCWISSSIGEKWHHGELKTAGSSICLYCKDPSKSPDDDGKCSGEMLPDCVRMGTHPDECVKCVSGKIFDGEGCVDAPGSGNPDPNCEWGHIEGENVQFYCKRCKPGFTLARNNRCAKGLIKGCLEQLDHKSGFHTQC